MFKYFYGPRLSLLFIESLFLAARMSNVESWCTVELTSDQSYNRKQRKHHPDQFKSTVFQVKNSCIT